MHGRDSISGRFAPVRFALLSNSASLHLRIGRRRARLRLAVAKLCFCAGLTCQKACGRR